MEWVKTACQAEEAIWETWKARNNLYSCFKRTLCRKHQLGFENSSTQGMEGTEKEFLVNSNRSAVEQRKGVKVNQPIWMQKSGKGHQNRLEIVARVLSAGPASNSFSKNIGEVIE